MTIDYVYDLISRVLLNDYEIIFDGPKHTSFIA